MSTAEFSPAEQGTLPGPGPSREELLGLYERILLIRRTEERLRAGAAAGKLPGAVHLYIGEEAVAVGVCAHLETGTTSPPRTAVMVTTWPRAEA